MSAPVAGETLAVVAGGFSATGSAAVQAPGMILDGGDSGSLASLGDLLGGGFSAPNGPGGGGMLLSLGYTDVDSPSDKIDGAGIVVPLPGPGLMGLTGLVGVVAISGRRRR